VASESIVCMSVLGRLHSCKSQQKCPLGSLSARRIQELVQLPPDVDYARQLWGAKAAGGGRCGSGAKQPCQVVCFHIWKAGISSDSAGADSARQTDELGYVMCCCCSCLLW